MKGLEGMDLDEREFTEELITLLRDRRKELGITQQGLCGLIGRESSGHQWIHKIESGKNPYLYIQSAYLLLKALKVKIVFEKIDD